MITHDSSRFPFPIQIAKGSLVSRQKIALGFGRFADRICDDVLLDNCHLTLGKGANVILGRCEMRDCLIESSERLQDMRWGTCRLIRSRFQGEYTGCVFGPWPQDALYGVGQVEECDFSASQLHLCEFYTAEPESIVLPSWPCFTIIDPLINQSNWCRGPLGEILASVRAVARHFSASLRALTICWPDLKREDRLAVGDEEAFLLLANSPVITCRR